MCYNLHDSMEKSIHFAFVYFDQLQLFKKSKVHVCRFNTDQSNLEVVYERQKS